MSPVRRWMPSSLMLAAAACVLAACTGSAAETTTTTMGAPTTSEHVTTTTVAPTTTTSVVAGDNELFQSADGYEVLLPSRWVPLDLALEDMDEVIDELGDTVDQETVDFIRESMDVGIDFSLFAIDVTGDPNVNVIVTPRTPLETVDNLEGLVPVQLEELLGVEILMVDRVTYGGLDGVWVSYVIEFPEGIAEGHQYYMVGEDNVIIFSFTTFDPETHRDAFPMVMETFRLTD